MGSFSAVASLPRRLEGKIALITGGASGIGECTARLFCRSGAKVVIADVQDELGQSVCSDLGPEKASFVHCDVTNETHVRDAVDSVVSRHGRLDVLFNNAGISDPLHPSIVNTPKTDFDRVVAINLAGVFLGTKHAARVMIPRRRGSIVNAASISGVLGLTSSTHAYVCSKHGVVGLTKNAAVELGRFGIRVNCVSPFGVATPFAQKYVNMPAEEIEESLGRLGNLKGVCLKPGDVADCVAFLASDDAKYVSGHNLVIDGGFTVGGFASPMAETGV